jgi:recombination protein RecT
MPAMVRPNQRLHPAPQTAPDAAAHPARSGLRAGVVTRFLQHDMAYGELALVCPTGSEPHHALDWQSERPVHLLRNVQRLTAPNPGFMTGPGTNSYLVGDAHTGFVAIDPGPADADHLQRLWRAAMHPDGSGGNIQMIVCTHSHPDHSPGAKPLQALCANRPPILGLPSAPTARAASEFTPDRVLQNQELLTLIPRGLDAHLAASHTLKAIHTPGHAANHVCLLLVEDGLLFSGDHILNGSTTVIDPPDGNMADYLDSLDRLLAACETHDVQFILPAHGHVLGGSREAAAGAISHLKAHRLKREAKIAAVVAAHPDGTVDDWLPLAYDDVEPRVWPVAKRSLLAHLERIQGHGKPRTAA